MKTPFCQSACNIVHHTVGKIPSIKSVTVVLFFFWGGGSNKKWPLTSNTRSSHDLSWQLSNSICWGRSCDVADGFKTAQYKRPCAETYLPNCRFQGPEWPLNLKPDSFPQVHTWFDKCRKYSQNLSYGVKMLTTLLHQVRDVVEEPLFYYHLLLPCGNKAIQHFKPSGHQLTECAAGESKKAKLND